MRKIAIIYTHNDYYGDYDEHSRTIIDSITDWSEVTQEEFTLLNQASYKGQFKLIERPLDEMKMIKKTVAEHLKMLKEEEEKRLEEKAIKAKKALEKKHKNELKDKESRLQLLKQLQEEFKE